MDEASLYSIAEDSRENFSERAPSEVGGFNDVGMNSSVTGGFPGYGDLEEPSSNTRVEVKWLEGDLDDMCSGGGALGPHTPSTKRSATQDHDEEDFLFPCYTSSSRRRRKRTAIVAGVCLGALVLLSVVIGVSISQTAGKSGSRTSQTPIVGDPNTGGGDKGPAEEDPQTDTAGPTAAPSWSNKAQIAEYAYSYVLSALGDCTPNEVLTDSSTPQGQIFLDLVEEVASQVTVSDSGNGAEGEDPSSGQEPPSQQFVLSPIHLHDYLIEKYALRMFFHTTTEQRWKLSIYWNSNQDLCDWSGVLCNTLNHEGTCSIYSLNLSKYAVLTLRRPRDTLSHICPLLYSWKQTQGPNSRRTMLHALSK